MSNPEKIKKLLPNVKKDVVLAPYTSFKIGGSASWFFIARTKRELINSVKIARRLGLSYFILGGGTNLLIADDGFNGLVIKSQNSELEIQDEKVVSGAGVLLSGLIKRVSNLGLSGLEFLSGIPGTVGGAVVGNAGISEGEIGDRVLEVEVLSKENRILKIPAKDCQFDYRESRFLKNKEIVLSVTLKLKRESPQEIKKRIRYFLKKRKNYPKLPSAGSVFKNPKGFFAGKLIEDCGLKGKRIGDAQISPLHANFIVNLGEATCQDVLQLILLAKTKVKEKFAVLLEEEIRFLGI